MKFNSVILSSPTAFSLATGRVRLLGDTLQPHQSAVYDPIHPACIAHLYRSVSVVDLCALQL